VAVGFCITAWTQPEIPMPPDLELARPWRQCFSLLFSVFSPPVRHIPEIQISRVPTKIFFGTGHAS
jgi:hypothetical protein